MSCALSSDGWLSCLDRRCDLSAAVAVSFGAMCGFPFFLRFVPAFVRADNPARYTNSGPLMVGRVSAVHWMLVSLAAGLRHKKKPSLS